MTTSLASPSSNLVTLLTPPGVGALAVVRVAGPATAGFLSQHFSKPARAGRCVHGQLCDDDDSVIDDPVVALAIDGAFADVCLHGGPWVVRRMMTLATGSGFTESAAASTLEAGDALEAELLAALPLARTELSIATLLAQPANWQALRDRPDPAALREALDDAALANLLRLPRVSVVGIANAGKSTLANALFGVERSITADLPGTTRDWVGEVADLDGLAVMLIDTPGLRDAADPIERRAIELTEVQVRSADLVVLLLDASQALEGQQAALVEQHPQAIVVLNKSEQPCHWRSRVQVDVETQARAGVGVTALKREIVTRFGCVDVDLTRPRCWTDRQRQVVAQALSDAAALDRLW